MYEHEDFDEGLDPEEDTQLYILRRMEKRQMAIWREQKFQSKMLAGCIGILIGLCIKFW